MNSKVEQPKAASTGDVVKIALAVLLVAAGVFAFYWWPDAQWRWLAVVGGLVAGFAVFMTSGKGAQTREFFTESRFELRKVVWPTRQEAGRATVMIVIAVTVISLILALFDWIIQSGVKALLGS
ncbi:Preprotein translocase subunit SecE [Lysobacter dokdonensis DS-58]|uniref:Protein translocase subunit SecE n=1 Tax=Lysobacter dokdonensis DS-58 TaxID=1300345 RepID=A0A0A2WH47_9GAMM|nr:preprotein translocase subunit SecE [Lysobacter dokdonensis]KGQ19516.1 Preprotein translocase subunit SecE [Lysobacter dokdonensis DS-58]